MPAKKPTAREGSRMREPNPAHPVARYCAMARAKLGMNPYEMAERIDKSRTAYLQYEQGVVIPATEVLLRISREAKLSLGVLSQLDAGEEVVTDPMVAALAAKIASTPPETRRLVMRMFSEAAPDKAVASAFGKPKR